MSVIVGSADRTGVEAGHDVHRLIGELQPLDMRQVVGAVARLATVVGDGDDVVGEVGRRAAVVDDDRVVGAVALEDGGVEIVGRPGIGVPGRISRTATSWPGL